VARQSYDARLVEVLVIDGGSTDRTVEIAREFGCRVLHNPRVQPEEAKLLGLSQAEGRYVVFLDSDEVLCDERSIEGKISLLESSKDVKNVITAGLLNPAGYPGINDYTNRFGDPFSYFMYRIDGGDYGKSLRRYSIAYEDDARLTVRFTERDVLPICDGGGHCFDLSYLKEVADITELALIPVIFNRMAERTAHLGLVKGDFTLHYSTTSVGRYIKKLRWRIIANVHRATGTEGFTNRAGSQPRAFQLKKYLFVLYGFSIIWPLIDACCLAVKYRKRAFLLHLPLSCYAAACITFQYILKLCGVNPKLGGYGD
jgi:glycosyltransferase involved in cell wall biosynthesis